MNKNIFWIILIGLLACKSENEKTNSLIGKWEIETLKSGIFCGYFSDPDERILLEELI
jgi:hypothetical protein